MSKNLYCINEIRASTVVIIESRQPHQRKQYQQQWQKIEK